MLKKSAVVCGLNVACGFIEDSIDATTFRRQREQKQLLQLRSDVTRGQYCLRRRDIAMVIVIFTGRSACRQVIAPPQYSTVMAVLSSTAGCIVLSALYESHGN